MVMLIRLQTAQIVAQLFLSLFIQATAYKHLYICMCLQYITRKYFYWPLKDPQWLTSMCKKQDIGCVIYCSIANVCCLCLLTSRVCSQGGSIDPVLLCVCPRFPHYNTHLQPRMILGGHRCQNSQQLILFSHPQLSCLPGTV